MELDSAQAALEQVNKRLDAELAAKSATELRAMPLAGQDTILLSALTVGLLVESYGSHRLPLLAAGATGGLCLFAAVLFADCSANPRDNGVLPGRLPDEVSDDLVAPAMKGPEFIARLMPGLQDVLVQNEINQDRRGRALDRAMLMAGIAVPLAIAVLLVVNAPRGTYQPVSGLLLQDFGQQFCLILCQIQRVFPAEGGGVSSAVTTTNASGILHTGARRCR